MKDPKKLARRIMDEVRPYMFEGSDTDDSNDLQAEIEKLLRVSIRTTNRTCSKLRKLHGSQCFYCDFEVAKIEQSVEHLLCIPGLKINHPQNLALAHARCNSLASDLPLIDKIWLKNTMSLGRTREGAYERGRRWLAARAGGEPAEQTMLSADRAVVETLEDWGIDP